MEEMLTYLFKQTFFKKMYFLAKCNILINSVSLKEPYQNALIVYFHLMAVWKEEPWIIRVFILSDFFRFSYTVSEKPADTHILK